MKAVALFAALTLLALAACSETAPPPRGEPSASYETRGVIKALPVAGDPKSELRILHEAVPQFKAADGSVEPMLSHTMGMGVGKGVSLEGLKVGDPVAFTFAVWWKPRPGIEVTRIAKLPADTEMDLAAGDGHDHHGHDHHGHDHAH